MLAETTLKEIFEVPSFIATIVAIPVALLVWWVKPDEFKAFCKRFRAWSFVALLLASLAILAYKGWLGRTYSSPMWVVLLLPFFGFVLALLMAAFNAPVPPPKTIPGGRQQYQAALHWDTTDATALLVMHNIYAAYKLIRQSQPVGQYLKVTCEVTAYSLLKTLATDDPRQKNLDILRQTSEILLGKNPVSCWGTGIKVSPGNPNHELSDWKIEHEGKILFSKREIVTIPAMDPAKPKIRKLLFFFEPLPVCATPYKLIYEDQMDEVMELLMAGQKDTVGQTLNHGLQAGQSVDTVDVVLHVPLAFRELKFTPGDFGKRLGEDDLKNYPPPPGFKSYGLRATKVFANQRVGFDVE